MGSGGVMLIQTSRFGVVEITDNDLIKFPEGLLGFNDLETFVLLDDPNDEIFAWLQSCEEPTIAFPVLEPELFDPKFELSFSKSDLEALQVKESSGLRAFCIITIPDDPQNMTANMKAPVVVNVSARLARQCVLQENKLEIREPIFAKLQQRVVGSSPKSIKSQALKWGVATPIKNPKKSEAEI